MDTLTIILTISANILSIITIFVMWMSYSINKYRLLKTKHKEYCVNLAEKIYPNAESECKSEMIKDKKIRKNIVIGQTIPDEILEFEDNLKCKIKCIFDPF